MQDLEAIGRELWRRGKAEDLQKLADSADGQPLSRMLDGKAVEQAAKSGDGAALRRLLGTVLGTEEGRRLAEQIRRMLRD